MLKAILVAAACVAGVGAADAAVMQAVWTGTIVSGYDQTGVFGAVNSDLTGSAYTMSFVFDPTLGIRNTVTGQTDLAYGGSSNTFPTPIISSSILINGKSVSVLGSKLAQVQTQDANFFGSNYYYNYAQDQSIQTNGSVSNSFIAGILGTAAVGDRLSTPASLEQPFSASVTNSACFLFQGSCGSFQFGSFDATIGQVTRLAYGYLDISSISVRQYSPAPVPLPASALLLAGAVAAAAGLRRTKRGVGA